MKKSGKSKKKIVRRIILWILLLLILAGAGFFGWSMLRQKYTTTYDSYTATTGSISNALSFTGNLNLIDSASYTAPASSTVRTVYVSAGDSVKEGDKLIRLANGNTIEADFDGTVNAVGFAEGDQVYAGDTLVQIADFAHMKVSMRVDEYDIGDVAVGQKCVVTVTSNEKKYESEIASIDRISASGGSVAYYTAVAYVDVPDAETLPGMQVSVSIPQEEATDVVILKADALSFDETNAAYVWMKDEAGELVQKSVTTGVSNGNYVEIKEGLSDGDIVYVEAKEEETSALGGLLSGLFGRQQFNNRGNMGDMPDMSQMRGGFGGSGSGGFTGTGFGSSSGNGNRSGSSGSSGNRSGSSSGSGSRGGSNGGGGR